MSDLLDALGGLTDAEFRYGMLHLADVAARNGDLVGLELIANATGAPTEAQLPDEVCASLQRLLTEAMAVGKEITIRKLCKLYDPHGEWIDVPKDWIGKGPGS
jgi:hypothetical protein